MNRSNLIYLVGGALSIAILIFGYQYYQDKHRSSGIAITVDEDGVSIQKQ